MNIIGVVGFADSGKGTVGEILKVKYGFNLESFANPVKDCCSVVFGWPRHLLEGDTKESRIFRETIDPYWSNVLGYDVTPRLMMQKMGTEAVREGIDNDIWLLSLQKRIDTAPYNDYVITDTRFPNEIKFIKSIGGIVVWVDREPRKPWYNTAYNQNTSTIESFSPKMEDIFPNVHFSEWAWIGSVENEYIIKNNGTLQDLENEVDNFMRNLYSNDIEG